MYDITKRVWDVWQFYDQVLNERIKKISEISGVGIEHFVKINPAEMIYRNKYQTISGYEYIRIGDWIQEHKTDDKTFLISPLDKIEETANQVGYKSNTTVDRKIRASKCEVVELPTPVAQDFFIRNHRQSPPLVRGSAISVGLVFKGEIVAVMLYDISNGAIRGNNDEYELVRLAIKAGARVHGGASKLQKACEDIFQKIGVTEIYSYSNATINSGAVYKQLGFNEGRISNGQPFVIMEDNRLERLVNLYPDTTDKILAKKGRIATRVGGNKKWIKKIEKPT